MDLQLPGAELSIFVVQCVTRTETVKHGVERVGNTRARMFFCVFGIVARNPVAALPGILRAVSIDCFLFVFTAQTVSDRVRMHLKVGVVYV